MRKFFIPLLILLIVISALGVRLYFGTYPFTDKWAEDAAITSIKSKGLDVDTSLPNYRDAIEKRSQEYKEFYQDPDGNFYLIGIDPYHFYGLAKKGEFDNFLSLMIYLISFLTAWPLIKSAFYIPIIFTILTIFPVYFIGKRMGNRWTGLLGAFLFALHPEFLKYSLAGQADTNTLNVFFFMTISWLFIEIFYLKKWRLFATGITLILVLLLYKFTWSGYYLVALLIIGNYILHHVLKLFKKIRHKKTRGFVLTGSIGFGILCWIFFWKVLLDYLPNKIQVFLGKAEGGLFPFSYFTITELQVIDLSSLIFRLGGLLFVIIALIGCFMVLKKTVQKKENHAMILVLTASIVLVFAGSQALRILPFCLPFLGIMFAFGIMGLKIKFNTPRNQTIYFAIITIVILSLLYIPFKHNYDTITDIRPRMDDSLYYAALDIKESSAQNARVFVWWDKGHIIEAFSERKVYQKAAPSMPRAYWMARVLMTDNDELAKGINRMLACNGESTVFNSIKRNHSVIV